MTRVLERLTAPKAPIDMVRRHEAEEFHGTNMEKSDKTEFWLEKLQRILEEVRCPHDQRVSCVVSLLQNKAYDWWKLVLRSPRIPNPMTWEFFVQEFRVKYVIEMYRESKWKQFLNLKQRNLSVAEYEKEFSHLSKYAMELVLTEAQKKKFSRGASSSSGKGARESLAQSEYSSAMRGRRQGSNAAPSLGRGASVGHGEIPEFPHCHRRHLGVCRLLTRGCF